MLRVRCRIALGLQALMRAYAVDGAVDRCIGARRRTRSPSSAAPALRIELPQAHVTYAVRDGDEIPLSAVSDVDGRRVSWLVDDALVGQSEPGGVLFLARPPRPRRKPTSDRVAQACAATRLRDGGFRTALRLAAGADLAVPRPRPSSSSLASFPTS